MTRFTLITNVALTRGREQGSKSKKTESTNLRSCIEKYEKIAELVLYEILPGIFVALSNGLSRENHYELYENINEECPGTRVISVIHENPLYAITKASKVMEQLDFYYEDGIEQEYYIGYFTPVRSSNDILISLAHAYSTLLNIALLLLDGGSLPLEMSARGILAALNKSILDQLEYIKTRVHMSIGVNYFASKAIEKATAQT